MQHQIWNFHDEELVASFLLEFDTKLHKVGDLHWNLKINTRNHNQYTISLLLLLQHYLQIPIVANYF